MNNKNPFPIDNPRKLKDRINNLAKKNNLVAGTVLQNYMMERFLERVSLSQYRDHLILKGGFLIAAMVGIDMRSTMDMDTTIKGLPVNPIEIEKIVSEILSTPINDNVTFAIKSIKPIHEAGEYEDFRLSLLATFFTIQVNLKLDITTGDVIIPHEEEYSFKLMFEDRTIQVKAYNLNTILAEKIESILARNVANTRARDYYDVYIMFATKAGDINKTELLDALNQKARERGTLIYVERHEKYIADIKESRDLQVLWDTYRNRYIYAKGIEFSDIIDTLDALFQ
ncbi:MAG: nucleotidyl transferase AbiEii/AbiGii toxin family protein [Burkholderiales bacterium]|jgi:predicted nucleotidyltransferase component of viral defense system|nr:nucleotidyl transferase AbiEii/AbiGii toxin family protein [Burkholderiales bacterium]